MNSSGLQAPVMEKVLAQPELLETILLFLDMKTLLVVAMRVHPHWKHIMDVSPRIQQSLFLQPVPKSETKSKRSEGEGQVDWSNMNPLLVEKFARLFFEFGIFDSGDLVTYRRKARSFRKLGWSQVTAFSTLLDVHGLGGYEGDTNEGTRDSCIIPHEAIHRRRFTRRGASWRRMLVSQPPPPFIGYLNLVGTPDRLYLPFNVARIPSQDGVGVRMGQLYDLIQAELRPHKEQPAWARVTWKRHLKPYWSTRTHLVCNELLQETSLVVEIDTLDNIDGTWSDEDTGEDADEDQPAREFDEAFRCDEFRHPIIEEVQTLRHQGEVAGEQSLEYET